MSDVVYIDEADIKNKRVLLRVDFNVSLTEGFTISDDERIKRSLPTIELLLKGGNKLILISHLDRPEKRDSKLSLKLVGERLQSYLSNYKVTLVDDFLKSVPRQNEGELLLLENIRFYPEEKANDPEFAKRLASLADVYVNDAFGVSHRADASIVGIPKLLPSYGGLLLKKEIMMISKGIKDPAHPVVVILGGAKVSTKIKLIGRLMGLADSLLIGGGIANTFLCAQGINIGKSYCEYDESEAARQMLFLAAQKNTALVLPEDAVVGVMDNKENGGTVKKIEEISEGDYILDIGPETQAKYGALINEARTIIWNGPVGYFENPVYKRGTDFIYYSIASNKNALSIVGGGDTIAAISKKEYLDRITHISTGGGAMLEFIEKGTLPGIEALKH